MAVRFSSGRAERSILTKIANRPEISNPNGNFRCVFRKKRSGTGRFHSEPPIQNSKFKIQNYCSGRSLRSACTKRTYGTRVAGLRPAEAAARCGSMRSRKFMIQNSRFKIKRVRRGAIGLIPSSGRGLRRASTSGRKSGREERAFAGRSCGPLRPFRARMKNEELKVKNDLRAAACGGHADSDTNCGPPPPPGCGPHGPDGPIPAQVKPAAERTGLRP